MLPEQDHSIDQDGQRAIHLIDEGVEKTSRLSLEITRIIKEQIDKFNNRVSIEFRSRQDDINNVKLGLKGGLKDQQLRQIVRAGDTIRDVASRTQDLNKVQLYENRVLERAHHELNRELVNARRSLSQDQQQSHKPEQRPTQTPGF